MVTWLQRKGVHALVAHSDPDHQASIAIARHLELDYAPHDTVLSDVNPLDGRWRNAVGRRALIEPAAEFHAAVR